MKYLSLTLIATLIAMTTACDDSTSSRSYQPTHTSSATAVSDSDRDELASTLRQMQAKDPSIKDVYYTYDEQGNKVLHVVQENKDESGQSRMSEFMWGLAGGVTGAMLLNAFMNRGGVQGMAQQFQPRSRNMYTPSQYTQKRQQDYRSNQSYLDRKFSTSPKPATNLNNTTRLTPVTPSTAPSAGSVNRLSPQNRNFNQPQTQPRRVVIDPPKPAPTYKPYKPSSSGMFRSRPSNSYKRR